ncbi:MAG: hypothetical protein J5851_09780 [Oscillospiraceae bacterium]|nr:hypothetical protein [Oscillospiraceae bacterium]
MFLSKIFVYVLYILACTALGIVLLYARMIDAIPDTGTQAALLVFALLCFALAAKNIWLLVMVILRHGRFEQSAKKDHPDGK